MKPFLYQVASLFYEKWGAEVSRLAFVFPNRRTGLFFQKYLSEVADTPLFSPTILTIDDSFYPVERKTIRRPDQYAFYPVRHLHPPKRFHRDFR